MQFLNDHGEGVYSVVIRTSEVARPIAVATRHGADLEFQQHREGEGFELDEATIRTAEGMSVTFLATDIPD